MIFNNRKGNDCAAYYYYYYNFVVRLIHDYLLHTKMMLQFNSTTLTAAQTIFHMAAGPKQRHRSYPALAAPWAWDSLLTYKDKMVRV